MLVNSIIWYHKRRGIVRSKIVKSEILNIKICWFELSGKISIKRAQYVEKRAQLVIIFYKHVVQEPLYR